MAAMVAGPMMELKKEEKSLSGGSMYPPEWWWAERQVSEVLAEHPGELVKTGETAKMEPLEKISTKVVVEWHFLQSDFMSYASSKVSNS